MKVGDRVKVKRRPDITGEVISVETNSTSPYIMDWSLKVTVKFDDEELIPREMEYDEDQLELILKLPAGNTTVSIKCECGLDSIGIGGEHSYYCPLYKE